MDKKEEHMSEDLKNVYKQVEKTEQKEKSYLSCVRCSTGCGVTCKDSCIAQSKSKVNKSNHRSQN